jgi:cellulose synthase/poly-beta-1,6-N-acetylglucosamine synthase-like glycosyltransferase
MLLSWTLTCVVALAISTLALICFGSRFHVAFRPLGLLAVLALVFGSGQVTAAIWRLPSPYILQAEILLAVAGFIVVMARPAWNLFGQIFMGSIIASAIAYLLFAGSLTFGDHLSIVGTVASALLLLLEIAALTISGYYTFESLDALTRVRDTRPKPAFDPEYLPRVSLQVAAYNEPPDMLIETIRSLEAVEYPNLEIVIIDNNTADEDTWRPVADYCSTRPRVRFVHAEGVEGFKAGALNLTLREYTDPDAELIGIIDADYLVDPDYLRETVGYFVDQNLAFLQTPQDYREYEGDPYLTACYDAYRYFFATSMPSRNERNSIIFAGTMGLIRRTSLEHLKGWDEWCITEDAEASLRLLMAGNAGLYLHRSFGRGIMPLTFSSLKSQRFRWCFGGIQILRKHYRDLLPWHRDPDNQLTTGQRLDYLFGGVQWFTDVLYLGFSLVLLVSGLLLAVTGHIALRPLLGAAILLPITLIASGMLRALWALRKATGIGMRRALLAFANWLSMSWTVARACVQAMIHSDGVFLRTPKFRGERGLGEALREARGETIIALVLWGLGGTVVALGRASIFLGFLFAWQGGVYASAPFMAWLGLRAQLSEPLERRRRTEERRDRIRAVAPVVAGLSAVLVAGSVAAAVLFAGAVSPGTTPSQPLVLPRRGANDAGPASLLADIPSVLPTLLPQVYPSPSPTLPGSGYAMPASSPSGSGFGFVSPSPSPLVSLRPSPRVSLSPRPLFSPSPSPLLSPSPSPSPLLSPSPSPLLSPSPSPSPSPLAAGAPSP